MPIISKVGRRSLRIRVLIGLIYTVLIVGSLAMLYPFGIMVSGSFKSPVDLHNYDLIPRYFHDDVMLYRKYVEERHNESLHGMNGLYRTQFRRFEDVYPPPVYSRALLEDWRAFLESDCWEAEFPHTGGRIPISFFILGAYGAPSFKQPRMYTTWIDGLRERFGSVEEMNRLWGTTRSAFTSTDPYSSPAIHEAWFSRRYSPHTGTPIYDDFVRFKERIRAARPEFLLPLSGDGLFLDTFVYPKCGSEIEEYNAAHGTRHASYHEVRLTESAPWRPRTHGEWQAYLADDWHLRNVRLRRETEEAFQAFLRERYRSFRAFAAAYGFARDTMAAFQIPAPVTPAGVTPIVEDYRAFLLDHGPGDGVYLLTVADWEQYVRNELHIQFIRITPTGEEAFRDYLRAFYLGASEDGSPEAVLGVFGERYGADLVAGCATIDEALARFQLEQPVALEEQVAVDFTSFISTTCPLDEIRLVTLDILFARYLAREYGTLEALNQAAAASRKYSQGTREELIARLSPAGRTAFEVMQEQGLRTAPELFAAAEAEGSELVNRFGVPAADYLRRAVDLEQQAILEQIFAIEEWEARRYESFREVMPQEWARDWTDLLRNEGDIRWEFIITNYRYVLNFILFHGRALINTAILVLGMVICALTVNPLAAYALSRHQLPSTYKVLLFFMATMAFPAEVTMIPNFLLLKSFPLAYLIQGAILVALFFGGKMTLGERRPRLWAPLEAGLLVGSGILVVSMGGGHPAVQGLYAAALALVVAAVAMRRGAGSWVRRGNTAANLGWLLCICVVTVLATPSVARVFGAATPTTSLLNTFFALILPTMANGYFIFLLKGFYDSLPQNLYESAQIEGASELWMFFRITVPLSKPIMAVIALQAFTVAYTTFMYAFIVCQDEKMWTLMVYIYELQLLQPQFIVFAALIIAAIPTLTVFIMAQRIILRGIIIPVEK